MRAVPDLILHGGAIRTLHPPQPRAEALAGGRFLAARRGADGAALAGPGTREVARLGRTVWPGLIVLDRAPETPEPAALAALRPVATLFEGRVVHGDL